MKKIFCYLFLFIICSTFFAVNMPAYFANASNTTNRTVFVVDGKFISATKNGAYIYDNADNCLKLLNPNPALSKSVEACSAIDVCNTSDYIYLLTNSNICCYDVENNSFSTIEVSGLTQNHTNISATKINNQTILCIYPNDTADANVLYAVSDNNNFTFYNITFNTQFNTETRVSHITFAYLDSTYYCFRSFDKSVNSYPIAFGGDIELNNNTTLNLTDNTYVITDIKTINSTECSVVVNYENKTDIYNFTDDTLQPLSFKASFTHRYDNRNFASENISIYNGDIYCLSNNSFYVVNSSNYTTVANVVENPKCTISYKNSEDFKFYKLTSTTNLILDLGSNETITLNPNDLVVEIADVYLEDGSVLQGYKYVLFTSYSSSYNISQNVYGYVVTDRDCLQKLDIPTTNKIVKVYENSSLYKYPSVVINNALDKNKVLRNISQETSVLVISYLTNYYTTANGNTTNYAFVKIGSDYGFIDVKSILSEDKRIILVIPNATLKTDTYVYEKACTKSNILHKLSETQQVKIIEPRNEDGFVKIAYNDKDGNYFEGYIKAFRIEANAFSTTQIIGTVLVLINLGFLLVLLITKKRIVK